MLEELVALSSLEVMPTILKTITWLERMLVRRASQCAGLLCVVRTTHHTENHVVFEQPYIHINGMNCIMGLLQIFNLFNGYIGISILLGSFANGVIHPENHHLTPFSKTF